MIVRLLTFDVRPGKVAHFNALIREQQALMRSQPGLVYVKLARRLKPGRGEEVVLFEEWLDPDALYGWAGRNLEEPRLIGGARELVDGVRVVHYEALDRGSLPDERRDPQPAEPGDVGESSGGEPGSKGLRFG
jgi:heme-degrading monooxygenase HmoA